MGPEGILDYVGLGGLYRAYKKETAGKQDKPEKLVCEAPQFDYSGQVSEEPRQTLVAQKDPPVTHLPKPKIVAVAAGGGSGSESVAASILTGGLETVAKGISSLLPVACGSDVPTISDFCDVPIFDPDGAINESLQTMVEQTLLDNNISFSAEMRITTNGQINDALIDGELNISIYGRPGLLGANEKGVLTRNTALEGEFPPCGGLMPVGVPLVDMNGGIMLEATDGSVFASIGQMRDRTFGEPVLKYDFEGEEINVVRHRVVDWAAETEVDKWFRVNNSAIIVNADGSAIPSAGAVPTVEEVEAYGVSIDGDYAPGPEEVSFLQASMTYFRTNGSQSETEYFDIEESTGYPYPDPALSNITFRVKIDQRSHEDDPSAITLQDIYMGKKGENGETIIRGLAIDDEGNLDFARLSQFTLPLSYTIELVDQRAGYGNKHTITEPLSIDQQADALSIKVPRKFYSDGTLDVLAKVKFVGGLGDGRYQAYIYSTVLGATASVYNPDEEGCK